MFLVGNIYDLVYSSSLRSAGIEWSFWNIDSWYNSTNENQEEKEFRIFVKLFAPANLPVLVAKNGPNIFPSAYATHVHMIYFGMR